LDIDADKCVSSIFFLFRVAFSMAFVSGICVLVLVL